MDVLLVTHYFPPEIGAPQARLGELARLWTEDGDQVTVLTCMPNHPTGIVPPEYRGRVRVEERVHGHRVLRTWAYATPNEGLARKTLGHVSFMLSAATLGLRRSGHADVVVVSSPTFFSIFAAWFLARCKRAPLVVEVRDLWPGIFVELGVLRGRRLIAVLERLELAAYRAAALVVVVSEGFRDDLIARGVPSGKVLTIRNGVDLDRFDPDADPDAGWRARLGAGDRQELVLYIGAHGISHGLDTILDAVPLLTQGQHVAFVGEGARKADLVAQAGALGLEGAVTFHDGVPSGVVPAVVAAADICVVPLRGDVPLFSTFIPSKMFELFAAGKPVVGAVRGEPAALMIEAGALVVEPGDPVALAAALDELAADPDRRHRMGRQARAYVEAHFDRRQLARRYRAALAGVVR